jgi:hypothetical protein
VYIAFDGSKVRTWPVTCDLWTLKQFKEIRIVNSSLINGQDCKNDHLFILTMSFLRNIWNKKTN